MRDHLVFYLNGQLHTVRGQAALLTVSEYLREHCNLVGTKVACAEGDCGACSVLLGRAEGARFRYQATDSCIAFVCQLDKKHLITVEALDTPGRLAPVQQQMVDCHGSQCGFCTPGFVVAMQGLIESAEGARLDEAAWRLGLSGNLCRCTGYAQILEAGLAVDAASAPSVGQAYQEQSMLDHLASLGDEGVLLRATDPEANGDSPSFEVHLPSDLEGLLQARAQRPGAKLLAGATDLGVQRNHGRITPGELILTSSVEQLDRLELAGGELVVGAAVTWSQLAGFVRELVPQYHAILERFGSPQVRHLGTLVGNVANASPIADSLPFLYATGSTVELASVRGARSVPIESFYLDYKQIDLADDEVITAVRTPLPKPDEQLRLYKVSRRRDMDISAVTAAFLFRVEGERITSARVALGGVGPTVVRARDAEAVLHGAPFNETTLRDAGEAAAAEVAPRSDVRGSSDYRSLLVRNLFVKCCHDSIATPTAPTTPDPTT